MQDYSVGYNSAESAIALFGVGTWLFTLAIAIVLIVACWKLYQKAGKPGWASIIPFYSQYVLFDIATGNGILFLLTFVPFVNAIAAIYVYYKLAKSFGKGIGYTLGLIFLNPIFVCMLAFGDAEYQGPQ